MNKTNIYIVHKDWVRVMRLNPNDLPEEIVEDGKAYYLNSVHRGDKCPDILDRDVVGCWYAETPSKGITSYTPVYLPPFV